MTKNEETGKTQLNISFPTFGLVEPGHDYDADTVGVVFLEDRTFVNCNNDGNSVTLSDSFFVNHPIYKNIKSQVIDSQSMVRIPQFYSKCELLTTGDHQGNRAWIISPTQKEGFHLHPAFKYNNKDLNQFWIGAYLGSIDSNNKMCSIIGQASTNSSVTNSAYSLKNAEIRANNRNTDGISGFMNLSVYQLGAIQYLGLIEHLVKDIYTKIGSYNYRGIQYLYGGGTWQCLSGIYINKQDKHIYLWKNNGIQEYIDTNLTFNPTWNPSGWYNNNYTLFTDNVFQDLFIPMDTNTIKGFSDFYPETYYGVDSGGENRFVYWVGSHSGTQNSLFTYWIRDDYHKACMRLAKI